MLNILEGVKEKPTTHDVTLSRTMVTKVCEDVVVAMFNGLPEEARTLEVFNYILSESKEMLKNKIIKL